MDSLKWIHKQIRRKNYSIRFHPTRNYSTVFFSFAPIHQVIIQGLCGEMPIMNQFGHAYDSFSNGYGYTCVYDHAFHDGDKARQ
jgi:hypothetical protein